MSSVLVLTLAQVFFVPWSPSASGVPSEPVLETVGAMAENGRAGAGQVYLKGGYGYVGDTYDSEGNRQDWFTELRVYNMVLGANYIVGNAGGLDLGVGTALTFASQEQTLPTQTVDVEFGIQGVNLFGLGRYSRGGGEVEARLGYLFELGEDPQVLPTSPTPTIAIPYTDLADAIVSGLSARYGTGAFRAYADVSYYHTLETEVQLGPTTREVNPPNQFGATLGGAVSIGPAEVGAALIYRQAFGVTDPATGAELDRLLLGVAPFVRYDIERLPLQLYAGLISNDEHYEYGISIAGKNIFAPGVGLTVGAAYDF